MRRTGDLRSVCYNNGFGVGRYRCTRTWLGGENFDVPVTLEQMHHRGVLYRMSADGEFRASKGWLETSVDAHPERRKQHLFPETRIDRSHGSL